MQNKWHQIDLFKENEGNKSGYSGAALTACQNNSPKRETWLGNGNSTAMILTCQMYGLSSCLAGCLPGCLPAGPAGSSLEHTGAPSELLSCSGAESGVWMGEDCSGRKVCWNVIAGDSMWPNDLLGNAMSDGWLYFIGILFIDVFTEALLSC